MPIRFDSLTFYIVLVYHVIVRILTAQQLARLQFAIQVNRLGPCHDRVMAWGLCANPVTAKGSTEPAPANQRLD